GTYTSATGVATNVTVLVIKFLATGNLTVSFGHVDPFGNTVGLNDGNFFLNTTASLVTDAQGHALDGARTGNYGTNGHDEFWRMYGDANGDRNVDGLDSSFFQAAFGQSNPDTNPNFWFMDYNMDNVIDNIIDGPQFSSRFYRRLNP